MPSNGKSGTADRSHIIWPAGCRRSAHTCPPHSFSPEMSTMCPRTSAAQCLTEGGGARPVISGRDHSGCSRFMLSSYTSPSAPLKSAPPKMIKRCVPACASTTAVCPKRAHGSSISGSSDDFLRRRARSMSFWAARAAGWVHSISTGSSRLTALVAPTPPNISSRCLRSSVTTEAVCRERRDGGRPLQIGRRHFWSCK